MSGSYRLQPPSPFPYSGGSRMEQALVPGLTGPNSSSMIGYALGAQLQRQADQMNYDQDMAEYNLTAQREAERAQQAQLADREAQRRNAITAALVSRHGGVMVPNDYQLTPEQARIARETAEANVNLLENRATAAGRTGTSTRTDPFLLREFGAALTEERGIANRLANLNNPSTVSRAVANATKDVYDPVRKQEITAQVERDFANARRAAEAELAAARERRTGLRPNAAQPQAQAAPAPGTPVPLATTAPAGSGEVVPPTARPAATTPQASPEVRAQAIARDRGGVAGRMPDGSIVVRIPNQPDIKVQ